MCKKWADCSCSGGPDEACKCGDSCACGTISTGDMAAFKAARCDCADCKCCGGDECNCARGCQCGGSRKRSEEEWLSLYKAKSGAMPNPEPDACTRDCSCKKAGGTCKCGSTCSCP